MSPQDSPSAFPDLLIDQASGVAQLGSQAIRLRPYPAGSLPCVEMDGMLLVTLTVPVRSVRWIHEDGSSDTDGGAES
nr:MAG TPA: hypothetical protein [Bacteriophage sp.]